MCTRPTCINDGCEKLVQYSTRYKNGLYRWRPHCSTCHIASYKNLELPEGITAYKTGYCSNIDSNLGFECPVDYEWATWAYGMTELDHIDGNRENNVPENIQELCPMCHKMKGQINGDYSLQNKY